jgi:RecB family endonuclease NucS
LKRYQARLIKEGLSKATTIDDDDEGIPMARMLAQVFGTLGFAWIDEKEAVTLTRAGEAFIASRNPAEIVAAQSRRYQIANPLAGGKAVRQIEVHPVPYLLEVLLKTKTLATIEYVLFCAKAKSFGDIDDTIESIQKWRALGPKQRDLVTETLEGINLKTEGERTRRTSIFNTIKLNSSYAIAFWVASRVISISPKDGGFMCIPRERLPEANMIVDRSQKDGKFIAFESKKDWMAFYGDPAKSANKTTALSYYSDTGQLDLVRQVLDEMNNYTESDKRNYLSMIVSEETVEDILARNMDLIEPGMTLVERQLITEVGRIDLFARDRKGTFTIIELKKGKSEDDVFGQLSRYLGWCKKTKARTENVRGIIIARQIGKKLWAAADGHATPIEFLEYDLRMSLAKPARVQRRP